VGVTDKWQQQDQNTSRIRMINNHQLAVMKGGGDRWGRWINGSSRIRTPEEQE
jgi:hypothetical protein